MKKLFTILLVVFLLLGWVPVVGAQVAWPLKAKTYTNNNAVNLLQDIKVYGISILATSASARAAIYDTATSAGMTAANCKGEVGEATQWDTAYNPFPYPVKISNLTVGIINGAVTVFYR